MSRPEGEQQRGRENRPGGSPQSVFVDGVRPATHAFLTAARAVGADHVVDERRKQLINIYFSSHVSAADLAREAGVSSGSIRRQLRSGLKVLWESLPTELQQAFPREEVLFLKEPAWKNRDKTPEHRAKLSEASRRKRQPLTEEHRTRIGEAAKGRRHTEESRRKISEAAKGRGEETRKKMSEALKSKGIRPPRHDRPHTDESRKRISESHRQRWRKRKGAQDSQEETTVYEAGEP